MSLVFEKLTQTLAAGQVWRLTIAADFFRIAAASWPVKVRILKAGRILGEMDGWQSGDFVRDVQFDAVEIEAGSIAQTVTVQIAGGGVGSDRVLGEVSVIDGARSWTISNRAYSWAGGVTSTPGKFGISQIENPIGSGRTIEIKAFSISVGGAASAYISEKTNPDQPLAGTGAVTSSKLVGAGGGSVAKIRGGSAASLAVAKYIDYVKFNAANTIQKALQEPIILRQGTAIDIVCEAAGVTINWSAEWIERDE